MSALQSFLDSKGLKKESLYWASQRLEGHDEASIAKAVARTSHKAAKKEGALPEKPKSGRGFSLTHLEEALAGKALPKKVRGKFLRAANSLLEKKKAGPATMQDLFGDVKAKAGKAPAGAKAKKKE